MPGGVRQASNMLAPATVVRHPTAFGVCHRDKWPARTRSRCRVTSENGKTFPPPSAEQPNILPLSSPQKVSQDHHKHLWPAKGYGNRQPRLQAPGPTVLQVCASFNR
jgi:hypothetical protein